MVGDLQTPWDFCENESDRFCRTFFQTVRTSIDRALKPLGETASSTPSPPGALLTKSIHRVIGAPGDPSREVRPPASAKHAPAQTRGNPRGLSQTSRVRLTSLDAACVLDADPPPSRTLRTDALSGVPTSFMAQSMRETYQRCLGESGKFSRCDPPAYRPSPTYPPWHRRRK